MSTTFVETITLERVNCGRCGATHAINQTFLETKRQIGGSWVCPYCQVSIGFSVGVVDQLRNELDEKSRALTASKCATLAERQLREAAEKKLHRVKNGTCPCCKRNFQNLQRHMKTQHPDAA